MGDPGGISPEVTLKALAKRNVWNKAKKGIFHTFFVCIGSPEIYEEAKRVTGARVRFNVVDCVDLAVLDEDAVNVLDIGDDVAEVIVGKVAMANAVLSYHALNVGTQLAMNGCINALVTGSINKEAVQLVLPGFTGHTEFLAEKAGVKNVKMLLQGGPLRVILVTTHVALAQVSERVNSKNVYSAIESAHRFLKKYAKIKSPKIAVCGLNPHCGEGGKIGNEESTKIMPAIKKALKENINVTGPLPADTVFYAAVKGVYDAVVVMYHDQGLGPLKTIAFDDCVNISLNLPYVRTSPAHGTAFDIAYQNIANPESMIVAIKTAIEYTQ